ncbi:OmpH family outer membrane protein [Aliiruegeria lutimaris]|uniref:Periplasmic chaperone for outer membrane proteins Skp n=1 Tax=Aliiruegeria lutimaris TaxID=571298 RepID=A0A1G8LPJ9_9RHOB|nr:OmpH family outer membrane protein [Aliiruegeria lutimaris]SDI57641.1 periplasmic chaperone for outer membrane proteins Skp [Aliiruegeria lutimaris]
MRRFPGQALFCWLLLAASLAPLPAPAQVFSPINSPVLTLDQDKLYGETLFGKRLQSEFSQASNALAERNRELTEALTVEELQLTEKRKQVSSEEFRALADAFDEKVVKLREDQDAKIAALQRRRDLDRRIFTGRVLPILSEIVRDSGAVALLDNRAVILSADAIDVTDRAIARIDAVLGDGATEEETAPPEDKPDAKVPAVE